MSPVVPLVPVPPQRITGTRLWPLSRASHPKQYWALAGDGEDILLEPIGRNTAPAVQPLSERSHAER